jgi:hypothetical protein
VSAPTKSSGTNGRVVVLAVFACVLALGLGIWALINTSPTAVPPPPDPPPSRDASVSGSDASASGSDASTDDVEFYPFEPVTAPPTFEGQGRGSLKVQADEAFAGTGMSLDARDAWIDRGPERAWAYAHLLVRNDRTGGESGPAQQIRALRVEVVVEDAEGRVLAERSHLPVTKVSPALEPGGTVPVEVAIEVPPDAASVRVSPQDFAFEPYTAKEKGEPLTVRKLVETGSEVAVEVRTRDVVRDAAPDGRFGDRIVLEVKNTGTVALRAVTLNVARLDEQGEILQVDPVSVARPEGIPLHEGETRVVSTYELLVAPVSEFRVELARATPVSQ